MKISNDGLNLIKKYEGLKLEAYLCPANVWTIGYGHTGDDVEEGMEISEEEATDLLVEDLNRFEDVVNRVKSPLTQSMYDALVSFTYNVGGGAFLKSTLLRKLAVRDYVGAAEEFPKWNKGGGRVLNGLVRRRAEEKALFLKDGVKP
jgi:lysozyme